MAEKRVWINELHELTAKLTSVNRAFKQMTSDYDKLKRFNAWIKVEFVKVQFENELLIEENRRLHVLLSHERSPSRTVGDRLNIIGDQKGIDKIADQDDSVALMVLSTIIQRDSLGANGLPDIGGHTNGVNASNKSTSVGSDITCHMAPAPVFLQVNSTSDQRLLLLESTRPIEPDTHDAGSSAIVKGIGRELSSQFEEKSMNIPKDTELMCEYAETMTDEANHIDGNTLPHNDPFVANMEIPSMALQNRNISAILEDGKNAILEEIAYQNKWNTDWNNNIALTKSSQADTQFDAFKATEVILPNGLCFNS